MNPNAVMLAITLGVLSCIGIVSAVVIFSDVSLPTDFELSPLQDSYSKNFLDTAPRENTRQNYPETDRDTAPPSRTSQTTKTETAPTISPTQSTKVSTPIPTSPQTPAPATTPLPAPTTPTQPVVVTASEPIIALSGIKKEIYDTYGIRVFDNSGPETYTYGLSGGLTTTELTIIKNILAAIPSELLPSNFFSIRVRDLYVNPHRAALDAAELSRRRTEFASAPIMNIIKPANKRGVNIFYRGVTPNKEDGLTGDNKTVYTDTYAIVVVHELNHNVDGNLRWCAEGLPDCGLPASKKAWATELHTRADHVLESAGSVSENYIRSNVASRQDSSFFLNSPQEFIASLSNAWFQNSMDTFQYCNDMLTKENVQVMSQCLLMMEIYSVGENHTRFYSIDTSGNITTTLYPITRDANGRLNGITIDKTYQFVLDDSGIVVQ